MEHTNEDVGVYDLAGMYAEANAVHGSEWLDDALCGDIPLDDFYAPYRPKLSLIETCRACPVKWNCLDTAAQVESRIMDNTVKHGIIGGLTSNERKRLYKKPRETWKEEQVKQIDTFIKERYIAKDLPEALRNALYPEGI